MNRIQVIKNSTKSIDVTPYLNSRGWTIDSQGLQATHTTGITGDIEFLDHKLLAGNIYDLSLEVANISEGNLDVICDSVIVLTINTNGYHQTSFTPQHDSHLVLRSSNEVSVQNIQIKLSKDNKTNLENSTVTWSEDRKGWISFRDYIPEQGFSMFTKLYTLKDGKLWAHDDTTNYNNFYGVQYKSSVKFAVAYAQVQTFDSIAIHANKVIGTTEDGIETQLGNISDLITFDFDSREGVHYANLLTDKILNDKLKGRYIVVELTDEESQGTKLQIFKIVFKSTVSTINE